MVFNYIVIHCFRLFFFCLYNYFSNDIWNSINFPVPKSFLHSSACTAPYSCYSCKGIETLRLRYRTLWIFHCISKCCQVQQLATVWRVLPIRTVWQFCMYCMRWFQMLPQNLCAVYYMHFRYSCQTSEIATVWVALPASKFVLLLIKHT